MLVFLSPAVSAAETHDRYKVETYYQSETIDTYGPQQVGPDEILGSFWNAADTSVTWSLTYEAKTGQGITIGFNSEWLSAGYNAYEEQTTSQTFEVEVPSHKRAVAIKRVYHRLSHLKLTRVDVFWCHTHNTYEELRYDAGEADYKDLRTEV